MGNKTYILKKKQPKALWTRIKSPGFRQQQERAHPERTAAGGIKARSDSEARRMESYRPIAELYKRLHPLCEACPKIRGVGTTDRNPTDDVHHRKGRAGLLLFDIRHYLAVCRQCHQWIQSCPLEARELGLDESHKI